MKTQKETSFQKAFYIEVKLRSKKLLLFHY